MSRFLALMGLLTTLVCTSPAPGQVSLNQVDPLPSGRILNRYGLEMAWWAQATIDGSRDKISQITIDERAVAMLTSSGILTMLDAETGQKLWSNRIGRRDQTTFAPVMNDRLVMVVAGMNVYALDRLTGRNVWNINLPKMPSTAPTADDDRLYVGTLDGSAYAFDLRKILELYQERQLPEYTNSAQQWRYQTGDKITSPPLSTGRSVLFASQDNSLYSVSARARRLLFQFETDAPVSAPIVVHEENLYLASQDFNFYCLNSTNGQVRWSFLSGFPIRRAPQVIEGDINGERGKVVYVMPELGGVSALNARTGRPLWKEPQGRAVEFRAAGRRMLFMSDELGNTLLLDRVTGNVIGTIPTITFNKTAINNRTDRLFLAREDGLIVMIREADAIFPTYHQFPDRRPILPELFDPARHSDEDAEPANENADSSSSSDADSQ